jgi:uncharacterized protein with PIN domain
MYGLDTGVRNTKSFIAKAKSLFGDRFDYNNTEYVNDDTRLNFTCSTHGKIQIYPIQHINAGCPSCNLDERRAELKRWEGRFIRNAKQIHGNKYDYSKVNYINLERAITIFCLEHDSFELSPRKHKEGQGCPLCEKELSIRSVILTRELTISQFRKLHGERYDYSDVEYVNVETPIKIICSIHGSFLQTPRIHKEGSGCPQCGREQTRNKSMLTKEQVIVQFSETHGKRYDYSDMNYVGFKTPIAIICSIHGSFLQQPQLHKRGRGCPQCAKEQLRKRKALTKEQVIEQFNDKHGEYYDYTKVKYIDNITPVDITCPIHGSFKQQPKHHKKGSGCPACR